MSKKVIFDIQASAFDVQQPAFICNEKELGQYNVFERSINQWIIEALNLKPSELARIEITVSLLGRTNKLHWRESFEDARKRLDDEKVIRK